MFRIFLNPRMLLVQRPNLSTL